jgi:hypothetical protein
LEKIQTNGENRKKATNEEIPRATCAGYEDALAGSDLSHSASLAIIISKKKKDKKDKKMYFFNSSKKRSIFLVLRFLGIVGAAVGLNIEASDGVDGDSPAFTNRLFCPVSSPSKEDTNVAKIAASSSASLYQMSSILTEKNLV